MSEEPNAPLVFLPAVTAAAADHRSFVAIVRTREEFLQWVTQPAPGAEWLQVEGLLDDPDVWAAAAQGSVPIPLDVMIADPVAEFSRLYRLADVRLVRDVRVTIPVASGFMKALRLAASLQLRVRLLPGQPSEALLDELDQAADFYLYDPVVEAPVEFFHTLLATLAEGNAMTLWEMLEQDPGIYVLLDAAGRPTLPADFVATHLRTLLENGAECTTCRWQNLCAGYFKWPDPAYSCTGIRRLLERFREAAAELNRDLAEMQDGGFSPEPVTL